MLNCIINWKTIEKNVEISMNYKKRLTKHWMTEFQTNIVYGLGMLYLVLCVCVCVCLFCVCVCVFFLVCFYFYFVVLFGVSFCVFFWAQLNTWHNNKNKHTQKDNTKG